MTLNGLFTLNFHYYGLRTALSEIMLHTYGTVYLQDIFVVSRDQQRCPEADRDPSGIGGRTADLSYRRKVVGATLSEP